MSSLTGNLISSTYYGLLKTVDNTAISGSTVTITDGLGNASALSLSTLSGSIAGEFTVTGALHATASNAISSSFAETSIVAESASLASDAKLFNGMNTSMFVVTSGSSVVTGSIALSGQLSFDYGNGSFVFPTLPSPSPVVGSAYFSIEGGNCYLYIYDGTTYRSTTLV